MASNDHPLAPLVGKQVVASTPWHITVGTLKAITEGYLIVTDAFRLHSIKTAKRRSFTQHVCSRATKFEPTHGELFLSVASIHTIFLVSSVNWKNLEAFENEILNVQS